MTLLPSSVHAALALLLVAALPGSTWSQDNAIESERNKTIFCYQCNSGVDKDCTNLQVNNTNSIHYRPCQDFSDYKGFKPFCRKIVQTIFERDNMVRVIRKCGWERHPRLDCYYMTNDDHIETVCQCFHDGCNSAPPTALPGATLAAILMLPYLLVS